MEFQARLAELKETDAEYLACLNRRKAVMLEIQAIRQSLHERKLAVEARIKAIRKEHYALYQADTARYSGLGEECRALKKQFPQHELRLRRLAQSSISPYGGTLFRAGWMLRHKEMGRPGYYQGSPYKKGDQAKDQPQNGESTNDTETAQK